MPPGGEENKTENDGTSVGPGTAGNPKEGQGARKGVPERGKSSGGSSCDTGRQNRKEKHYACHGGERNGEA